jgi:putative ABC transport system substrate-binding protein
MEGRVKRRHLLTAVSVLAMVPSSLLAQRSARIPTVGLLWPERGIGDSFLGFRDGLKSRGYIEGKTIVIESRHLVATVAELDAAAERLVAQKVDVILAFFGNAVRAARKATQTIPIVAITEGDPVAMGYAVNLARPGANVTGVTGLGGLLVTKRLEILKDSVPGLRRVAGLTPNLQGGLWANLQAAATKLNLTLIPIEVRSPSELDTALAPIAQSGAQAIFWIGGLAFGDYHRQVVEALGKTRLPAIYPQVGYARNGGLMSYSADMADNFRIAARYVDQILKGAKPGELPFEQASKFEFVVNLRAAKAQGIQLPEIIMQRATKFIQ